MTPGQQIFWADALDRLTAAMVHGPTLHLQNDASALAQLCPGMLTTDLQAGENVLVVSDPRQLPFPDQTFRCIVGVDVLARSPGTAAMLAEAERVLVPFGRLVLVEPWTSPLLGLFLHRFRYRRRVWAGLDPWYDSCPDARSSVPGASAQGASAQGASAQGALAAEDSGRTPFQLSVDRMMHRLFTPRSRMVSGNADNAHACLVRRQDELGRYAPSLSVVSIEPFGGISEWLSLRPDSPGTAVRRAMAAERRLMPAFLRYLLGSRALCVIEKASLHRDR